jgi:EAL domain-containing protein (putative c-di-GMP-specific phosphodiesterase class I)/GGDEF domain-containing protein
MSLIKQLWLVILGLVLLAFVGSLVVGVTTSRHYIEQEVRIKNADNANALALSMTQLDKDPVTIELLVAAQFDTGHYRRVELRDPEGEIIERRVAEEDLDGVPGWFVDLVRLEVPAGRAVVQDGWQQYGTVILESQHSYAYHSLWRSALSLAAWFAVAGLISLLLGWWVVRTIRKPLHSVVDQARDIGARRFTTSREPRTRELRNVVQAMNQLSASVRDMLGRESDKLDQLRRRMQHDTVTGVLDRKAFMGQLQAHLDSDGVQASGAMALVRFSRLAEVNQSLGHQRTDELLRTLAHSLDQLGKVRGGGLVARLKGGDFALLFPGVGDLEGLGRELGQRLQGLREEHDDLPGLPSALIGYAQGNRMNHLLASLDGALAEAEGKGERGQVILHEADRDLLYTSHADWRTALHDAMQRGVYLGHYPVLDAKGRLMHMECPSRLRLHGEWRNAGVFMPWISRLELDAELDLAVARTALTDISQRGKPVGINLSPASIRDARFVMDLRALIASKPEAAARLWLELPEAMAIHDLASFRSLCRELQPYGCKLGLEHVGSEFTRIADLHDLGLAYLKIDASLVHGVAEHPEQQTILRGMATLCHSLGILAIAEGVRGYKEATALFELGLDGVTGPGVRQHEVPPDKSE